jgi:hypothetical protein
MSPERMRDPYLNEYRWILVGCTWCGARGRYRTREDAQRQADRHNDESGARSPGA